MKIDVGDSKNREGLGALIALSLSIFFLILSNIGWLDGFKNLYSYITDPVYVTTKTFSNSIQEYFDTLWNISEFREEYNRMKLKIAQDEALVENIYLLISENEDLRNHHTLSSKQYKYMQANVLGSTKSDSMILNLGLRDGIQKGDVVVLGKVFIGLITEVNSDSSTVRLPTAKASFLEVYIVPTIEISEIDSKDISSRILSRAVVNGSLEGIKIENISMNSQISNGDIVIVNDEKVGENIVLGVLVGLSEDPAKTTRTGFVSPSIDYYDLNNVFVRKIND